MVDRIPRTKILILRRYFHNTNKNVSSCEKYIFMCHLKYVKKFVSIHLWAGICGRKVMCGGG